MAHYTQRSVEDNNFKHLVYDVAWFGLAFVTINRFLSVYALRVGATPTELGWIVAGPPIGMVLSTLIAVWWRERYRDSIQAVQIPTFLFRLSFLLLAFTPLFPMRYQPLWMIVAVTLPSLPQGLSGTMFMTLMKEATPDNRMTTLLGRRVMALNLTLGIGAFVFGLWLEHMPFPANYAVMFGVAFALSMVSQWHLTRIKPLDPEKAKPVHHAPDDRVRPMMSLRFRRMFIVNFAGHLAFFSVFPIVTLRLVRDLGASEGYMATFTVVELMAGAGIGLVVARLVQRFGNRHMLGVGLTATALAALSIGLVPSLPFALVAALINGAAWAVTDITMVGHMVKNLPSRDGAYYSKTYMQGMWTAMFIAPFIGTYLAELGISLTVVLAVGAGLRLGAAAIAMADLPMRWHRQHNRRVALGIGD